MLTSGFAEAGAEGRSIQQRLLESTRRLGLNLLGPNRNALSLPVLQPQTVQALRAVLPAYASTLNPLDVTGGLGNPDAFEQIIEIIARDPAIGFVAAIFGVPSESGATATANVHLGSIARAFSKPHVNGILMTVALKALTEHSINVLTETGLNYVLQGLRAAKLLQGFRGVPGVDLNAVAENIVKIGDAALALGSDLVALEVNPLAASGKDIEALDALAVWSND